MKSVHKKKQFYFKHASHLKRLTFLYFLTYLSLRLIFLSLSNITHLFPLYVRVSSTVLKFLQGFQKLAVFSLRLTKFSIFLKSTCLLLAIFLKFIFSQKGKRGFIWPETFNFLVQNLIFIQKKKK